MNDQEAMNELLAAIGRRFEATPQLPIRQKTAKCQLERTTTLGRRCRACGASFLALAPGKTGERGLWGNLGWWCSQECYDGGNR